MTLDPVHVEGIARLADRIAPRVDADDHREFATTVWENFLDPLVHEGRVVLDPVDEQRRFRVDPDDAAVLERPFPTQHGLDAGTVGASTYANGVVLDVAQAAMAGVPSDLSLHRERTVVGAVHTNDETVPIDDEWRPFDAGHSRQRLVRAPRTDRYEGDVVHALALYHAESEHALAHADVVEDLLVLDGPIYPTGILRWADHAPELEALLHDGVVHDVLENYVALVDRFLEREVPLVGFVKSSASRALTRIVRDEHDAAPWANDAALFRQVLERRDDEGERRTDAITCTNWFRSAVGTDAPFAPAGDAAGVDREREAADYQVTFFAVYDPRSDLLFRVEAPYGVTRDPGTRERIRNHVLAEVATERGPPLAVAKADDLARIGGEETAALRDVFANRLDAERQITYDDVRWGPGVPGGE